MKNITLGSTHTQCYVSLPISDLNKVSQVVLCTIYDLYKKLKA